MTHFLPFFDHPCCLSLILPFIHFTPFHSTFLHSTLHSFFSLLSHILPFIPTVLYSPPSLLFLPSFQLLFFYFLLFFSFLLYLPLPFALLLFLLPFIPFFFNSLLSVISYFLLSSFITSHFLIHLFFSFLFPFPFPPFSHFFLSVISFFLACFLSFKMTAV